MHIQLEINEKNADFFLQYLNSLKEGIVEKMTITEDASKSFMVSSTNEVHKRIESAEKNADYQEHDLFWKELGVNQLMKVIYEKQFRIALKDIAKFIAVDKVSASTMFKKELKNKFEMVCENPKMYRKSIYFDDESYRDLIFMGYTAIYKIEDDMIKVLDIFKWIDK